MTPTPPTPKPLAKVKRLAAEFGVHAATAAVCRGHSAPGAFLADLVLARPALVLALGPRGGGKSYLSALATHVDSLRYPGHGTRILGGSLAQSQQIYNALKDFDKAQPGDVLLTKTAASYVTGSDVSILAASSTSVRGPHIPTLRLDEIDEIDPEIRESAVGMCMAKGGVSASISMTSTWHRIGGPMSELIERGRAGEFPFHTFCAFEVLERCPDGRSGPNLEHCPACPLVKWCHDTDDGVPKAKRSDGHYAIDSLIQKVKSVSLRVFEADYLCLGPKADGLWFPQFDEGRHVSEQAEFDPHLETHLAVDSGVFTGAVFYQLRPCPHGGPNRVLVFADYLAEGLSAEQNARALLSVAETHCRGIIHRRYTDPAGGSRNPIGPTVLAEFERAGLPLEGWPRSGVADGLSAIESALLSADGSQRLWVHPRCRHLVNAFRGYRRARRAGQWMDYPEDPQHPHEDLMDSLRGGFVADGQNRPLTYGPDPFGEDTRW
jgi:hypothetical protein